MLKILIPTPCHENWDAMTPNMQGRHCSSCAKTVVDFTNMSDEAIKYFFINKKEERVCGRFRNEQLHRITIELPQNIFHIQMPYWKQFLVASLLVFSVSLFSCNTTVKGDVIEKPNASKEFTVKEYSIGKGFPPTTALPPPAPVCTTMGFSLPYIVKDTTFSLPSILQGDISIVDSPVIKLPAQTIPEKMGEIKMQVTDSNKIKNLPKADSIDCNKQTYY